MSADVLGRRRERRRERASLDVPAADELALRTLNSRPRRDEQDSERFRVSASRLEPVAVTDHRLGQPVDRVEEPLTVGHSANAMTCRGRRVVA